MAPDPPTENDISMVIEVTSVDRVTALKYLQAKQNDPSRAISAILDGEDIDGQRTSIAWDDSVWASDRDGVRQGFQQQPYLSSSAAPTRGSSPVPSLHQPKTQAEADDEMEKALAMSRQEFGSQESGVVDGRGHAAKVTFAEAHREYYDPSQWSMTLADQPADTRHSVTELFQEVIAKDRQHHDGVPRFVRQLPTGDYLPSLITIGHSIPLLRSMWLTSAGTVSDYGYNPDWWRGAKIELPKIVRMDDASPVTPDTPDEVLVELQRLMAFLDSSRRLYASAQPLATIVRSAAWSRTPALDTLSDQTLSTWEEAAARQAGIEQRPTESIRTLFHSIIASTDPAGVHRPNFWTLPLTVTVDGDVESASVSLGETIDSALWDTAAAGDSADHFHDTFMERCAEVLVMRVSQANAALSSLGLVVPAEFYVDRYLKENIDSTRALRSEMAGLRAKITRSERIIARLETVQHPSAPGGIKSSDMFRHVLSHYNGGNRTAIIREREARGTEVELPDPPPEFAAISEKLRVLYESINEKLKVLQRDIDTARVNLRRLSEQPADEGDIPRRHRYSLRGVVTKPGVTYVLRPKANGSAQQTASLLDDDPDEEAPPGMQWWRIESDIPPYGGVPRVLTTPSTTDDVLRAVELEHNAALLVYASDKACAEVADADPPAALQDFVRRDNQTFENEMALEAGGPSGDAGGAFNHWSSSQMETAARRGSADSTTVNVDEHSEAIPPPPPSYESVMRDSVYPLVVVNDDDKSPGPDHHMIDSGTATRSLVDRSESPPVHEIRLDDGEDGRPSGIGDANPAADADRTGHHIGSDIVMCDVENQVGLENEAVSKRKRESGP